jgi:hypothetical protein
LGTSKKIVKLIAICGVLVLCNTASHAGQTGGASDPNGGKVTTATIELTKLDVNDSFLKLSYKIRNNSDHDVWACSSPSSKPFEIFLTQDRQTLLIRKRLNVPANREWYAGAPAGTYIRLRPGDDRAESLLVDLPVKPEFTYALRGTEEVAQTVRRLAIEIGYYDEDLPALVRSILDVAGKFSFGPRGWAEPWIIDTYFPGLLVHPLLETNKDPYGQGFVYIVYSNQGLIGEKVLRIDANGVSIPYKGYSEKE